MTHRKATAPVHLKAVSGSPGTYDAVVAVFGNVDLANERVQPGAFTKTLERWAAAGDPIPVIFSHRWDDIDAHVGIVKSAEEVLPGDARLAGTGLEANGGLLTRIALDISDPNAPYAKRLNTLLERRSVREFSWAFDVPEGGARMASDGVLDLTEVDLFEVGPCLKGMNPDTALLTGEGRRTLKSALAAGVDPDQALIEAELAGLEARLEKGWNPDTALLTGQLVTIPAGTVLKVWARPDGSVEQVLDQVYAAATTWALDRYADELYAVHLDGTYPAENRTVVIAERWSDPLGEGPVWELHYAPDDAGVLAIGAAREVDVIVTVEPKARKLAARSRVEDGARSIVAPVTAKLDGKTEEPTKAKVEDPTARSDDETTGTTPLSALIEAQEAALTM